MSPINGMGYSNGQKVPQVSGNIGNVSSPNKVQQKGGNSPASGMKKDNMMNGNHMPGAKYER